MMNEENKNYKKIGTLAVVFVTILAALAFYFNKQKWNFSKRDKLYSVVENASDLQRGTSVLARGFKIGELTDLNLIDSGVLLELSLNKNVKINKSAEFFLGMTGVFGARTIEVKNLKKSDDYYSNGDTVHSEFIEIPITKNIDSVFFEEIEPSLKELSRTVGKALQDYGESK